MLKLKELHLSGIGRFVEEQSIFFDRLGNLVQVDGVNNNTGGSSGAGKSTLFQAIEFLFGINDVPNGVLKSRLTESGLSVKGVFDYDGKLLTISRGKKLRIDNDGKITEGSSKLTEEELDKILSIPRDLFRKMLHKRQKEGGFFLKMGPKEINEFLMNCLGLSSFKAKIEKVDGKITFLTKEKDKVASSIESAKSALKATQEGILSLGLAPVKDIHQSVILELKQKLDNSTANYNVVVNDYKVETDTLELSRPQITVVPFDRSALENLDKQSGDIKAQIDAVKKADNAKYAELSRKLFEAKSQESKLKAQIAKAESSKVEAVKLAGEIKKIRESICPTCEQTWQNNLAKAKETELLAKVLTFRADMAEGPLASETLVSVSALITKIQNEMIPMVNQEVVRLEANLLALSPLFEQERQKERDHQMVQNDKNKQILAQFSSMQASLRQRQTIAVDQARGQVDVDRRAYDAAVSKLKAYEDARVRYENSLNSLKNQETTYSAKLEELTKNFTDVDKELLMAEELKRALKSYLSCSFDDALETIGENATRLIRCIPNMSNATIQLEGTKETQEGKIKEEVNAVIHMDGEENVDIRSLCGGERTSTDLAIDLSVIDLIETRANKGIDVFILDEPFDGLDTVCIEMALEVLKNSNVNKKLFIVDHNPEVKQMVESKLVVTRTGPFSKITQS